MRSWSGRCWTPNAVVRARCADACVSGCASTSTSGRHSSRCPRGSPDAGPAHVSLRIAALVPAYQAAAHLGEVLAGLAALPEAPHVLVVDDGSRDATAEVARQCGVQVISFAANRGKGHALLAGFATPRTLAPA